MVWRKEDKFQILLNYLFSRNVLMTVQPDYLDSLGIGLLKE